MVVFGITGGSGSGKTSVSKMLEKLGVHIIDTDVIAHEIVEPNSDCLNELVDYFGDSILNDDKTLNRKKLASIAFSDKQKNPIILILFGPLINMNSITGCDFPRMFGKCN